MGGLVLKKYAWPRERAAGGLGQRVHRPAVFALIKEGPVVKQRQRQTDPGRFGPAQDAVEAPGDLQVVLPQAPPLAPDGVPLQRHGPYALWRRTALETPLAFTEHGRVRGQRRKRHERAAHVRIDLPAEWIGLGGVGTEGHEVRLTGVNGEREVGLVDGAVRRRRRDIFGSRCSVARGQLHRRGYIQLMSEYRLRVVGEK